VETTADALADVSKRNTSPAYEKWVGATSWPLLVVALIFLVAYALPILQLGLEPGVRDACHLVIWVAWAAFVLDYLVRLALVPRKRRFVRQNWLDLLFLIIPVLRPLAILRLVTVFLVIDRHAGARLRARIGLYLTGGTALLVFAAAVAILDVERGAPDANITNFWDAVWWACVTVTTVGYGDLYPVTGLGRLIAVGLMVGGIALLGIVTASFASWLVELVSKPGSQRERSRKEEVRVLRREVETLRALLDQREVAERQGRANEPR